MISDSPVKKLIVFSHSNCAPCTVYEKNIKSLEKLGWNDSHIHVIKHRGQWELPIYPISILFVNNQPKITVTGALTEAQITELYYKEQLRQ